MIRDYIFAQARLQTLPNPSGHLEDGSGLGEPKFKVDETVFTGSWGRPQRDGPALRATALVAYSNWLISSGEAPTVKSKIWPIVANDLAYVGQYWNQTTFDLWEEVRGSSFFTTAAQYRALVEGNTLADRIGKSCSTCVSQAPQILCFLQSFWNGQYIVSNINAKNNSRTGKDANSILASIYSFDPSADCDDATFQPCSPRALANHKAVIDTFRNIYAINSAIPKGGAVAIGRYAEDVYQGGNPWYSDSPTSRSRHLNWRSRYLTTLAAAEFLYAAIHQYSNRGSITITSTNRPFFLDLYPSITVGTYNASSPIYSTLTSAMKTYADGFLSIVQKYTPTTGFLAEQLSRTDGTPLSAANLTWSYAAFLTATARREGQMPPSWGAEGEDRLPTRCEASSARGTYAPACPIASEVAVTFEVRERTSFGETVYLTGSVYELGGWDEANAIALSADRYTGADPVWRGVVTLPAGLKVEYIYFLRKTDGEVRWEDGYNRVFSVPEDCVGKLVESDVWR